MRTGNFLMWQGVAPDQAGYLTTLTEDAIAFEAFAYDYYSYEYDNEDDPDLEMKVDNADIWLYGAGLLAGLDFTWCGLIGALGDLYCLDNDGIVPTYAQRYPDGPNVLNLDIFGPSHQEEKASGALYPALQQALNQAQVGQPGGSSGGSSVSGFIDGPSYPSSPGSYLYTAIASGGTGSYTYRWYLSYDGSNYYDTGTTAQQYSLGIDYGSTFWLRVIVTSGSAQATADLYIQGPCSGGVDLC